MREILARLSHVTALTTQPTVLAVMPPGGAVPGAELLLRDGDRLVLADRHFVEKDSFPLPKADLPFLMHLTPYVVQGQPVRLVATFESHEGKPVQAELWTLLDHQIHVEQRWDDRPLFSGAPFLGHRAAGRRRALPARPEPHGASALGRMGFAVGEPWRSGGGLRRARGALGGHGRRRGV